MATTNSDTPASKAPDNDDDGDIIQQVQERFSPEEEAATDSNAHKAEANTLFTSGKYDAAINKYDEAVAVCPNYLEYEVAVLRSNISACHLKLEEWKEAVTNATTALDALDRLERQEKGEQEKEAIKDNDDDAAEVEIVSAGAAKAGPAMRQDSPAEAARRKRQEDIARIRAKALMRRARARSELNGWSNLEGAIEDYKKLDVMTNLTPADRKIVQSQLRVLPPRAKAAQEKETAEMWAKLKDLGNGILKPFGLSTDSFNMVKDEKTGGYSLNFAGGSGSK
ncbi:Tetratricopeptide repeat protein 1 [Podospora fimiseda]|uniref:Tetratricopeptide repeat protein 1 n=1 Tax=Podospora fimiseda TaxID=252190 RepID=A0AAN7BP53_9PEZI|nr:Tetratricopeptide repeat protein 1 [Podospora fimiseda]